MLGEVGGDWPLVGRSEEADLIVRHLRSRDVIGIVLVGAAGVGKTRLAREVAARLSADGWDAAWTAATSSSSAIPMGALAPVLGPIQAPHGPLDSFDVVATATGMLSAGAGRRVLIIDDAHHLDDVSATVVHHLALSRGPRILCTVRSGMASPDAVSALWRGGLVERLELANLSRPELDVLVRAALGGAVDAPTSHRLWQQSSGNPLLLRELIVGGIEADLLRFNDGAWRWSPSESVPRRVTEVIDERIGALASEERAALEAVAVGEPLPVAVFWAVVSADVARSLERRGLIDVREDALGNASVRTAHPLYGEAVRASLGQLGLADVRRSLAGALEASGPLDAPTRLRVALWRLEGGDPVDAKFLEQAAVDALATARPLVERFARPAWESTRSPRAGLTLALELAEDGRIEEAVGILTELQGRDITPAERAEVTLHLAPVNAFWLGNIDLAIKMLEEGAGGDSEFRSDCLGFLGAVLLLCRRADEGAERALQAVDDPGAGGDRAVLRASMAAVPALAFLGRTGEAIALAERVTELPQRLNPRAGTGQVIEGWSMALCWAGRIDEAVAVAEEYHRRYTEALFPQTFAIGLGADALGQSLLAAGQIERAAETLDEALRALKVESLPGFAYWTASSAATAHALMGGASRAEAILADASSLRYPAVEVFDAYLLIAQGWVAVALGAIPRAVSRFVGAADVARAHGLVAVEALALHAAVRIGEPRAVVERLIRVVDGVDAELLETFAVHATAAVANNGDALDAVAHRFEAAGALLMAAEAAAQAAVAHARAGSRSSEAAALHRSRRLLERCSGARLWLPVGEPAQLSAREREVALLAARGLTNREVADRLNVSARTVESHLQHAYNKLGVNSRAGLADVLGVRVTEGT